LTEDYVERIAQKEVERMYIVVVISVVGGIGLGWGLVTLFVRVKAKSLLNIAREKLSRAEEEIRNKKREAEGEISRGRRELELEKKEELHKLRTSFEKETKEKSNELHKLSKRLMVREESLERQVVEIEKGKEKLTAEKQKLEKEKKEIKALGVKQKEELERIAEMSTTEAKKELLESVKKEAEEEAAQIIQKVEREAKEVIQKVEQEAKETADQKAREIVATAIQRCAVDEVTDATVTTLSLPDDEMKGRVIGKEGRNIKAFEALTGVDLIVNDAPETVTISCFDPLRRKIAEMSLKRLIADGRIQPARIEETVEKAKEDVQRIVHQEGQRAAFDLGISDFHSELIDLLGRLKFRTSYGQNVLQHSKEVANIAGIMASEIGTDSKMAKRAGLLHDIGKAVSQESNGSHAIDGAEIAKRCGESSEIVHAIAAHHEDEPIDTVLASLIQAADAVSAARPGARREVLEKYLKRLEQMEGIACSFRGVSKAYAVQAGRELRVMVIPKEIDDWEAEALAREIAQKIEEEKELKYPGQIKITIIRELRFIDYAKHK